MKQITDVGYDGRTWLLIDVVHRSPVKRATILKDFRGETARIDGGRAPHKPGSTGKVHVDGGEFYPGVFGCVWIKV